MATGGFAFHFVILPPSLLSDPTAAELLLQAQDGNVGLSSLVVVFEVHTLAVTSARVENIGNEVSTVTTVTTSTTSTHTDTTISSTSTASTTPPVNNTSEVDRAGSEDASTASVSVFWPADHI